VGGPDATVYEGRVGTVLFAKPEHSLQDTKVGCAHNPKGAFFKSALLLFNGGGLSADGI